MVKEHKLSRNFDEIVTVDEPSVPTGNETFDKWFSRAGGLILKAVIFLTGTSGAGKTTLMWNLMEWLKGRVSSFYSREMLLSQIKFQLGYKLITHKNAHFSDINDCPHFNDYIKYLDKLKPSVIIIDSLQSIAEDDFAEMGTDAACAYIRRTLTKWCQKNNAICFIIGHNTKEGEFAGKNTNMQMVDAHMVMKAVKFKNKPGIAYRQLYWGNKTRLGGSNDPLYYEIQDGQVKIFTPDEYASKLTEILNEDGNDVSISCMDAIKKFVKDYSAVDSAEFTQEFNKRKTECRNRANGNDAVYYGELIIYLLKLRNQFGF